MAKDKNVTPKVEKKKVETPKVLRIASVFQEQAQKGALDRKTLAGNILAVFKEKGITKNVRGHEIREERVLQQISAMLRDIRMERGKTKGSWWSKFSVEETDDLIKIVPKD